MPQEHHRSMRAAGKMLLQPLRKKHSAKPAHGSVLDCTCITRMICITRITSIEAHYATGAAPPNAQDKPLENFISREIFVLCVVSYSYHKRIGVLPPECECRYLWYQACFHLNVNVDAKKACNLFLFLPLLLRESMASCKNLSRQETIMEILLLLDCCTAPSHAAQVKYMRRHII